MATSSKEISVFVPERKLNRVQKRYAKRKTTVRAFTFVKDWQSPLIEAPHVSALSSVSKKSKGPVLANSSIISSSSSAGPVSISDVSRNPLSPASLSRVSPSPVIIPNQSPRARLIAANQQKASSPVSSSPLVSSHSSSQGSAEESSSKNGPASTFRTPMSPPSAQRVSRSQTSSQSSNKSKSSSSSSSQSIINLQSSPRSQSIINLQSSPRSQSSINLRSSPGSQLGTSLRSSPGSQSGTSLRSQSSTKSKESSRIVRSSQRKSTRSSNRLQANNDLLINSYNNSILEVNRSRRRDQSKVDTEKEEDVDDNEEEVRSSAKEDQEDDHVEGAGDMDSEDDHDDGGLEQMESAEEEREPEKDGREEDASPTPEPTPSVHILTKTPAEKSMRIVHRTPVSGPVNRVPAKKRKPSPVARKEVKQAKKTHQKKTATGSKAKVRLWVGSGRRRTAVDTTDLDIVLAKIEDMAIEYRQNRTSKAQQKAIGRFYQYVERDLTDKIDLAQEYKTLKSSLSKMNSTTRKQRKQLLELQQRNVRLDMQIAEMKKKQSGEQERNKSLQNISSFLTNLQNLQKEYAATKPKEDKKPSSTSSNLDVLLTEAKVTTQSRRKLRGINNKLQDWLDTH